MILLKSEDKGLNVNTDNDRRESRTQNRDRHRAHAASDLDAGDAEASGHSHRAVVDGREECGTCMRNSRNANWPFDGSADKLIG